MLGVSLYAHALRVLGMSLPATAKMSLGPVAGLLAIGIALQTGLGLRLGPDLVGQIIDAARAPDGRILIAGLGGAVVVIYLLCVALAVGWQRYVLMGLAVQGVFPPAPPGVVLRYAITALTIALGIAAIGLGGALVMDRGLAQMVPALAGLDTVLQTVPVQWGLRAAAVVVAVVLFLRVGCILPPIAISDPVGVIAAWRSTYGASGTLLLLAVLHAVTVWGLWLLGQYLGQILPPILPLWLGFSAWLTLMLAISIQTTIYAHYVEGQALG
jgi:hypothetical protein